MIEALWRRKPPRGVRRPMIRVEGDRDPEMAAKKVPSNPRKKQFRRHKSSK